MDELDDVVVHAEEVPPRILLRSRQRIRIVVPGGVHMTPHSIDAHQGPYVHVDLSILSAPTCDPSTFEQHHICLVI